MRPETIKILKENTGTNFSDIGHSNIFLDMCLEARKIKAKMNYWDYIKIKSFCTAKGIINKIKKQSIEWENIFANYIYDKVLISKTYKEFIQPTSNKQKQQKTPQQFQIWAKDLNR